MRVAILDDFTDVARTFANWSQVETKAEVTVFHDHLADAVALVARLKPFEVITVMRERTPFPRALIEKLPNLKLLVTSGMRNASIDVAAATERSVVVCGTDSVGFTTAEHAWAMLMAAARNIPQEEAALRRGTWQLGVGSTLRERRLGILGLGKIGGQVATLGKAFGMDVVAWSQNLTDERCRELGVKRVEKDDLLRTSDFITIHLVLSARTRDLIGAREFDLMKRTAILVNTSRGPIVNEAALLAALNARRILRAALDVYDVEPLPKDHPILKLDNAVLAPHLGYVNDHNYRVFYPQQAEAVLAFLNGAPIRVINPDVSPSVVHPDVSREAEVLAANAAFYAAFTDGNLRAMDALWAREAPVACVHPGWPPVRGRDQVMNAWDGILKNPPRPAIRPFREHVMMLGEVGMVIGFEAIGEIALVATNVFARENGAWKIVHHQASVINRPPHETGNDDKRPSLH